MASGPPLDVALLRGGQVAAEFDAQNPPPAGYAPRAPCTAFPPGGVYLDFFMWAIHFFLNLSQIMTFFLHSDWIFGTISTFSMALNVIICSLFGGVKFPLLMWRAARYSAVSGEWNEYFQMMLVLRTDTEGPAFAYIVPYGMMLNSMLTKFQSATAAMSFLLSMKMLANNNFRRECAGCPEELGCVAPRKAALGLAWSYIRTCCELTLFTVASTVLHPLIVAPAFLVQDLVNILWVLHVGIIKANIFLLTTFGKPWGYTSTMLLPQPTGPEANIPACAFLSLTLIRVLVLIALMFGLDLPHGLMKFGTLGRPMGWTLASLPGDQVLVADGSLMFRQFVLVLFCFTVPLYLAGNMGLLVCHSRYRRGELDEQLWEMVDQAREEIAAWGKRRAIAHGWAADPTADTVRLWLRC